MRTEYEIKERLEMYYKEYPIDNLHAEARGFIHALEWVLEA